MQYIHAIVRASPPHQRAATVALSQPPACLGGSLGSSSGLSGYHGSIDRALHLPWPDHSSRLAKHGSDQCQLLHGFGQPYRESH